MNVSIDPLFGHEAEFRAERRVYEPTGMTKQELFDWYMEQPAAFRRSQRKRIASLGAQLLCEAIEEAAVLVAAPVPASRASVARLNRGAIELVNAIGA